LLLRCLRTARGAMWGGARRPPATRARLERLARRRSPRRSRATTSATAPPSAGSPEMLSQLPHPDRCRPVAHRRHEHHHRAEVDLPPEEAQRGRGVARPAAVLGTAKAAAPYRIVAELGTASRFAPEKGRVQHAATNSAAASPHLGRTILVTPAEEEVQPRIAHQSLP